MHLDDPFGSKFKRVYMDLPNLEVLTKRAIPGDIQVTYAHASVGNKFLKKTVTDFALSGYLEAPTVDSIDIECAFDRKS